MYNNDGISQLRRSIEQITRVRRNTDQSRRQSLERAFTLNQRIEASNQNIQRNSVGDLDEARQDYPMPLGEQFSNVADVRLPTVVDQAMIDAANISCNLKLIKGFLKLLHKFEMLIISILVIILGIFIVSSVILTCYDLVVKYINSPHMIKNTDQYQEWLGEFFYALIGLELLSSVMQHFSNQENHVEAIILVAITAMARKIIILDYNQMAYSVIAGIGLLFGSLGFCFFALKFGQRFLE